MDDMNNACRSKKSATEEIITRYETRDFAWLESFASCQFVVSLEDTLTMTRKINAKKSSLFSLAILRAMISVTPLMFPSHGRLVALTAEPPTTWFFHQLGFLYDRRTSPWLEDNSCIRIILGGTHFRVPTDQVPHLSPKTSATPWSIKQQAPHAVKLISQNIVITSYD